MNEISRRRALQLFAGGAALGSAGLLAASPASAHGELQTYSGVWGERTVYEPTGNLNSFTYRPSFHDRMSTWLEFWYVNTGPSSLKPMRLWTYGVHTDARDSEAHNSGRGFDLSRIYATDQGGNLERRFFARYDIWKDFNADERAVTRRHYWATSASLHYHFRNVLTYPYNSDHWNHIHIDNLVSGLGNSEFDTTSKAQVLHVQASCNFVWGKNTAVDGDWGPQTSSDSTEVLRRIGRDSGTIASSQGNWLAFNKATMRKGFGTQDY